MSNTTAMFEAALDLMDEGVVLLDDRAHVTFWNKAAEALTGYRCADLLSQPCPKTLYKVDEEHMERANAATEAKARGCDEKGTSGFGGAVAGYSETLRPARRAQEEDALIARPVLVALQHHLGHPVPAMLRKIALNDPAGKRIGLALLFYPVEESDSLPHGEEGGGAAVERSQADMEDRMDAAQHQWIANRVPYGLLWVTIDQAAQLRKTHGRDACESMLRIVEQTLARGLRPAEAIGRWGSDEFVVLSHARSGALLAEQAQRLAGFTRTAEFRWWGDRVNLTASIGMSLAIEGDALQQVLSRAQEAVHASLHAGGNHVTEVRGR